MEIPEGFCQCGCGQKTSVVKTAVKSRGLKKGDCRKFVNGHQGRTSPKATLAEHALIKGYGSELELLKAFIGKHKTQEKVALELGCSTSWIGRACRKFGIKKPVNARLTNEEKRKKYNRENGTEYATTREWLARLYEQYGYSRTVAITGAKASYICQCYHEQRKLDGKSNKKHIGLSDDRPSNLSDWKNPDKSPCTECKFSLRDKNQPGCAKCPLPEKYVQLVEARYYPGAKAPHQAPVYYNARGHAHNYHDWGVK
jgi:hypothetical protein